MSGPDAAMAESSDTTASAYNLDPYTAHEFEVPGLVEGQSDSETAATRITSLTTMPLIPNHIKQQCTMVKALAESMRSQWSAAPKDMKHWTCSIFQDIHCLPKEANDKVGADLDQNVFDLYNDTAVTLLVFLELMTNEQHYRKLLHQKAVKADDLRDKPNMILAKCEHLLQPEAESPEAASDMQVDSSEPDASAEAMDTETTSQAVAAKPSSSSSDVLTFSSEMDHTLQYNILDCAEQKTFTGNEELENCHLVGRLTRWVNEKDDEYGQLRKLLQMDKFETTNGFNSKYHLNRKNENTKEAAVCPFWFPWKPYCMQAAWGVSMAFGINYEKPGRSVQAQCSYFHKAMKPDANHANASQFTQYTELSYVHAIAMCNLLRVPCTIYTLDETQTLKIKCSNDLSRPVEYESETPTPRGVFGLNETVHFKDPGWAVQKDKNGNRVPHVQLLEVDLSGPHVEKGVLNMLQTDLERPRKIFMPLMEHE